MQRGGDEQKPGEAEEALHDRRDILITSARESAGKEGIARRVPVPGSLTGKLQYPQPDLLRLLSFCFLLLPRAKSDPAFRNPEKVRRSIASG